MVADPGLSKISWDASCLVSPDRRDNQSLCYDCGSVASIAAILSRLSYPENVSLEIECIRHQRYV